MVETFAHNIAEGVELGAGNRTVWRPLDTRLYFAAFMSLGVWTMPVALNRRCRSQSPAGAMIAVSPVMRQFLVRSAVSIFAAPSPGDRTAGLRPPEIGWARSRGTRP